MTLKTFWREPQKAFIPRNFLGDAAYELDFLAGPGLGLELPGLIVDCPEVAMDWLRSRKWCPSPAFSTDTRWSRDATLWGKCGGGGTACLAENEMMYGRRCWQRPHPAAMTTAAPTLLLGFPAQHRCSEYEPHVITRRAEVGRWNVLWM